MKQDYGANRELKRLLGERGMSAAELAARSGVHYGCLCRVLREERPLYADELLPLAQTLGVMVETLLG